MEIADSTLLYRSTYSRVERLADAGRAVLRATPRVPGNPLHVAKVHHEQELLELLGRDVRLVDVDLPGQRGSQGLEFDDPGGVPLESLIAAGPLPLPTVLWIGVAAARLLHELHSQRVLVKDINPDNLLVDVAAGSVHLCSHAIASRLPRETLQIVHPGVLEGDLQYISPEQTGRMNRGVDYRSDFYSLGATLYAALTGAPPFSGLDPLGLVHAHIATPPTAPHKRLASVPEPEPVSAIALRLLSKNAEDRYQSAAGVLADLRTCERTLDEDDAITPFELGAQDASARFAVPEKLYGREAEMAVVLAAFDRVAAGRRELLLVSGYSGIGKSALVQEVHKPIVERRGHFVSGKFEQFRRGIPYLAFGSAFRELILQLLTQSTDDVAWWRTRILAAVGDAAQVLVDVIPELELVLGPQPPVPVVDPLEAESRFTALFKHFVSVFAAERPLVVFLDDLQWADQASLKLLRTLMTDPDPMQLLLVGAYRDNEVNPAHPLMLALAEVDKAGGAVNNVVLAPLSEEDITELVADTLRTETHLVSPLAALLTNKTQGNPFFLIQFFETVHNEGLVWRDAESGQWSWNASGIGRLESTDNVVDLMVRKLRELPDETQNLLRFAACIGTSFELGALATVTRGNRAGTAQALWAAVEAGMLVPMLGSARHEDEGERTVLDVPSYIKDLADEYRFLHDRVQQGAYLLSRDADRPRMHHEIGWLLRGSVADHELEERVFDIVDHLNSAGDELTADERLEVAALNLMAGLKARSATAYDAADRYAATALDLLGGARWDDQYELMRDLTRLRADCRYLLGHHDDADRLFDEVLAHVPDPIIQVLVHNQKAVMFRHQNRYDDGLRAAIAGLAIVDIEVPWHEDNERIGALMGELSVRVAGELEAVADLRDLVDLPEATDALHIAAMDLIEEVIMVGYFFNPMLIQIGTLYIASASLKNGNCSGSASAWATYGMTIASAMGRYEDGEVVARVGLELSRRYDQGTMARTAMWYAAMVGHWRIPAQECVDVLKEGVDNALRVGIPVAAGYNAFFVPVAARISGMRLDEFAVLLERYALLMEGESMQATVAYRQLVRSLRGEIPGGGQFDGGPWNDSAELSEATYVQYMHDSGLALSRQHYYNARTQLFVYWNRPGEALPVIATAKAEGDMAAILFGQIVNAEWALFQCLAIAGGWDGLSEAERSEHRETLNAHLANLAVWAEHAPMNFEQMHRLAAAESARIDGRGDEATALYDQAIDAAHAAGHPHIEALAAERAARFHLSLGDAAFARGYLTLAHTRYTLWGATAKSAALEQEFPRELGEAGGQGELRHRDLDVATVVAAFQAMSQEIELSRLLERMLDILVKNAGAELGVLLLEREGELFVEAIGTGTEVQVLDSEPLSQHGDIPTSLIAYVNRTGETVVLDDASQDRRFSVDPAVRRAGLKSVLCMPVVHQRRSLGVLYLANSLSTAVFTPERAALLTILGTQAAISIENARLFARQRRQAESFARFVPSQFLEHIGRTSIEDVQIGDAVQRSISVLFSDLRDFTSLSESMTVEENFGWLNGYLGYVSPVIDQHQGFIDKFVGDAVMALFPAGGDQAVGAAIELHAALRRFNRASEVAFDAKMGVGVHTGPLMLGTVGSSGRMDTTVIGDAVNLAARLESLTKYFGVQVLISGDTRSQLVRLADTPVRQLGRVRVKGRRESTTLFEVLAAEAPGARDRKLAQQELFAEATELFYGRRFADAARAFEECVAACPEDRPAARFVERARGLMGQPPAADWDGTETLGFK